MHLYRRLGKPSIDYAFAAIAILLGWPFLLIIYVVNRVVFTTGFFIQERVGRNERRFACIKFRSMKIEGEESSIPPWGKFLRYSSIDELPQVINVLRGEMSWVGPRPLLTEYLPYYSDNQRKRHMVKPGITGLAQVNGRNSLSWEKSLALDTHYAENVSFQMDLKIVFKTIPQVFKFGQVQQNRKTSRTAFNKSKKE
jgi:undecaprenyl phosphate N,N'-diacetylbacillosamine 1-phosphate transferase